MRRNGNDGAIVKALSLRQPWANAVLYLGKTIENRVWRTHFRGEFLIHAAQGMTVREYAGAILFCRDAMLARPSDETPAQIRRERLTFGALVGRARIVDVVEPEPQGGGFTSYPPTHLAAHRWHMREQFGFCLVDVVAFERPIPWAGFQRFFEVPFDRDGRRVA